jgi:hypothetical protein
MCPGGRWVASPRTRHVRVDAGLRPHEGAMSAQTHMGVRVDTLASARMRVF